MLAVPICQDLLLHLQGCFLGNPFTSSKTYFVNICKQTTDCKWVASVVYPLILITWSAHCIWAVRIRYSILKHSINICISQTLRLNRMRHRVIFFFSWVKQGWNQSFPSPRPVEPNQPCYFSHSWKENI